MEDKNKDVDLYAELKKTLEDSEVKDPSVPSDQKPKEKEADAPKDPVADENGELSEDEISKLGPKAQKRIRDLADQVKELAAKPKEEIKAPETKTIDTPKNFKDVKEFLNAVEDEPSRKLLEAFYGVIKGETQSILGPLEQKNNDAKFESEFAQFEKIEGLADHKSDLKKTFLRDPSQSLKALVGEVVMDLSLNKIKPIDAKKSDPKRGGPVDTSNLSKDELYATLETLKP